MKNSFFVNENQLEKWLEAAEGIEERFGIEKALGYLIGEKFYTLVQELLNCKKIVRSIAENQKKPNFNPIVVSGKGKFKRVMNLDKDYQEYKRRIFEIEEILNEFANMIKSSFESNEIRKLFNSNPRLGVMGHICSEEIHKFLVEKGMVEHSIETEVEDALIFGEMTKFFKM